MHKKIIDLILDSMPPCYSDLFAEQIADNLIANGATIPIKCKECQYYKEAGGVFDYDYCAISYYCDGTHRKVCEKDFCSNGKERK